MSIPDSEIIERLNKIGGGSVTDGFRMLCTSARICSNCGESWDNPAHACECTRKATAS